MSFVHRKVLQDPVICPSCGTQITTLRAEVDNCIVPGMCCICSFCGQFSRMTEHLVLEDLTDEEYAKLPFVQKMQMVQMQRIVLTYIHEENDQGSR